MRTASTTPPPTTFPDAAPALRVSAANTDPIVDRTDAMLRMMTLGMSLDEIEQQLDWVDAQSRLKQR